MSQRGGPPEAHASPLFAQSGATAPMPIENRSAARIAAVRENSADAQTSPARMLPEVAATMPGASMAEPFVGTTMSPTAPVATLQTAGRVCPTCGNRFPVDFKVCPHDASPLADAAPEQDSLIGSVLGDSYRIVRALGEGGMGRVYEARHTRLPNKRYAVKILHPEFSRQADVVLRFQREAEAASGIQHPNVIGVYDVHTTSDGRPYMVCEFLEGEDFGALLDRIGKADLALTIKVLRAVCQALAAAHQRGVVHRDLKPENVFLSGPTVSPTIKVLDFGISKIAEPESGKGAALTRTGVVMGTPAYMAPEQAMGLRVDARADTYAAGAILYRALTGRRPFLAADVTSMLTAVLTEEPPRPRSLDPQIPEGLEIVIQRAMAKEPADRFQSMEDLDAALAPFDTAAAIQTTTTSSPQTNVERSAPTMVSAESRQVKIARPMLVVLTLVGFLWIGTALSTTAAGIIRLIRSPRNHIDQVEGALVVAGITATLITPFILWVRQMATRIWQNTPRVLSTNLMLKSALLSSLSTYSVVTVGAHLISVFYLGQGDSLSWPIWSLLQGGFALIAAIIAIATQSRLSALKLVPADQIGRCAWRCWITAVRVKLVVC